MTLPILLVIGVSSILNQKTSWSFQQKSQATKKHLCVLIVRGYITIHQKHRTQGSSAMSQEADPYNDEFECARCHQILDIEDSVRLDYIEDNPLVCAWCSWIYYNTSKVTKEKR